MKLELSVKYFSALDRREVHKYTQLLLLLAAVRP